MYAGFIEDLSFKPFPTSTDPEYERSLLICAEDLQTCHHLTKLMTKDSYSFYGADHIIRLNVLGTSSPAYRQ